MLSRAIDARSKQMAPEDEEEEDDDAEWDE
jgi:hypothetical protein